MTAGKAGCIRLGSRVRIRVPGRQEQWWRIVGRNHGIGRESLPEDSPLAQAIMGGEAGLRSTVRAPGGHYVVEVLEVQG
jgi:transcription elongation GreA/GreB family factor